MKNGVSICNKRKIYVKPTIHQNSAVLKTFLEKFWNHWLLGYIAGYLVKLLSNHIKQLWAQKTLKI